MIRAAVFCSTAVGGEFRACLRTCLYMQLRFRYRDLVSCESSVKLGDSVLKEAIFSLKERNLIKACVCFWRTARQCVLFLSVNSHHLVRVWLLLIYYNLCECIIGRLVLRSVEERHKFGSQMSHGNALKERDNHQRAEEPFNSLPLRTLLALRFISVCNESI